MTYLETLKRNLEDWIAANYSLFGRQEEIEAFGRAVAAVVQVRLTGADVYHQQRQVCRLSLAPAAKFVLPSLPPTHAHDRLILDGGYADNYFNRDKLRF